MELGFACGKTDIFIERQPYFLRFIEYSLLKDGAPLVQFGSTSSAIKPPSEDNKLRQDQLQTEAETELKVIYYR